MGDGIRRKSAVPVRLIKISENAHDYLELLKIFYFPGSSYDVIFDKIIDQVELQEHYKSKLMEF